MQDSNAIRRLWTGCFDQGIDAELVTDSALWGEILNRCLYVTVDYTWTSLQYQSAYMRCFTDEMIDLSVSLKKGKDHVLGIWPIGLKRTEGQYTFVTNQGPVLPPKLVEGLTEKQRRSVFAGCITAIKAMYRKLGEIDSVNEKWDTRYSLIESDEDNGKMTWYQTCMEDGAVAEIVTDLYADLRLDEETLHQKLRKSYRSLINEGERIWSVSLHTSISDEEFDELRLKHAEVSGRITRSLETWELQKEAVNQGASFLIYLRDTSNKLVGGAIFSTTRDEGTYDVGVYDRELFDKPIGHVIQWHAIRYMKSLGVKWYQIGPRFYKGDYIKPTEKQISIAYYKEGFATNVFPRIIMRNRLK